MKLAGFSKEMSDHVRILSEVTQSLEEVALADIKKIADKINAQNT